MAYLNVTPNADRVLESFTTTGTGPFALSAAVTGYRRFNTISGIAVGDMFDGYIEAVDANGVPTGDRMTGRFIYSAANQVTTQRVYSSSNSDAAVNWSAGTKYIGVGPLASQNMTQGQVKAQSTGYALP